MPLLNKNRIAYLGALTLLFSYAEMFLPRFIPFFRLGLSNIIILLALGMDFPSFIILTIIKALAASVMNGTLLSPFFLISIAQSFASGLVMFVLFKIKKNWLGLYGISIVGGAISSFVQIGMSALYLGSGTLTLIGPMLLFSMIASIITATGATYLNIPKDTPNLPAEAETSPKHPKISILFIILILATAVAILSIKNLIILTVALIAAFTVQLICGRKIKILPHISIWLFVIISTMLSPSGKIWFKIGNLAITQGAFFTGVEKALKLSAVAALSQCATKIKINSSSLLSMTLKYFSFLQEQFKTSNGNLFKKIKATLQLK